MRTVHVHRIAGIGGSERHLLTLLPALAERGVDVRFAGLDVPAAAPDAFYDELEASGIPFVRERSAAQLVRAIHRLQPELVHTHLVHADVFGAVAAVTARATLVSTKHNDDPFRSGPFRYVERALTRRAARVICITGSLARFQLERVGLPAHKLTVVHYGLDELPRAWAGGSPGPELPADAHVLLAVSRLTAQKGLGVAVRALATLRREHPGLVLVVLGEGPEREQLQALALELGVTDSVHLPGRVGDVAHWYRRADMLVHPARWEGFGLALLEAMLAGLPVVASDVSSIPEIVRHGETGLLVPPDDPAALAAAIERVLQGPTGFGSAGLARAHEEFSVARMAEQTLAVYESARSRKLR
jgi:glycosyltransferase involved in cell wall biosynthesis